MDKVYTILGSSNHYGERQAEDFYATPRIAIEKMLNKLTELNISLPNTIIEPSVGNGAIANVLLEKGHDIIPYDIVDRGFPNTNVVNFLEVKNRPEEEIAIVANFPFSDILNHTEHSLSLLNKGEYLISLAKIQFLETKKREKMFRDNPPKYVLVFSERIACRKNDQVADNSAICFCWYIFEKGWKGMPMIDWITGNNK